MRILKFAVVAAMLILPAASVQASVLANILSFDGIEDVLVDESAANIVNGDTGMLISDLSEIGLGDVIYGVISISDRAPDAGLLGTNQVAFLFSAEIVGGGVGPEGLFFSLGETTLAGFTLTDLVDPAFAPVENGLGDAIAVVISNPGGVGDIDPLTIGAGAAPGDLTGFASADFTYEATVGLGDGTDDFFQFLPVGVGGILGVELGGFSFLDQPFAPGATFLDVLSERFDGLPDSPHQVTLTGTVFDDIPSGGANPGFAFNNDSDFTLNPVPEPTTFVVWGLLSIAGMSSVRRRRSAA